MKFFKTVHTFNYEWSLVSAAQWQKYPNDHCPHVQHVDVLNRTVDPETGILTTERLITVKQNMPRLILKVHSLSSVCVCVWISILMLIYICISLWVLTKHNMWERSLPSILKPRPSPWQVRIFLCVISWSVMKKSLIPFHPKTLNSKVF